uniref:Uncharacterized protein n=1 Tax=uncultured marine virus TaxID=186617 RepID=A0A0F7L6Z2_9VIRU|nr:hypothetical protein [uncultured marine virus]
MPHPHASTGPKSSPHHLRLDGYQRTTEPVSQGQTPGVTPSGCAVGSNSDAGQMFLA